MEFATSALVSNLVISGVMAIVVLGITLIWRNPYLTRALWLCVLVKLVIPPFIQVPVPTILPDRLASLPTSSATSENLRSSNGPSLAKEHQSSWYVMTALRPSGWSVGSIPSLFFLVWGGGAATLLILGARQRRRIAMLLDGASSASACMASDVAELSERMGLDKRPEILQSGRIAGPLMTLRKGRPVVLLPKDFLRDYDEDQRRVILAHELTHVKRRDLYVNVICYLVLAAWWWNPFAWWAYWQVGKATESCCDADVIRLLPHHRKAYGEALFRAVELQSKTAPALPGCAFAFSGKPLLLKRIKLIMKNTSPPRKTFSIRLFACLLALISWPLVFAAAPDEEPGAEAPAAKAPLPAAKPKITVKSFDLDGSGSLDKEERALMMKKMTARLQVFKALKAVRIDTDNNGRVDRKEFSTAVATVEIPKKQSAELFNRGDADKDGFLDENQLDHLLAIAAALFVD